MIGVMGVVVLLSPILVGSVSGSCPLRVFWIAGGVGRVYGGAFGRVCDAV